MPEPWEEYTAEPEAGPWQEFGGVAVEQPTTVPSPSDLFEAQLSRAPERASPGFFRMLGREASGKLTAFKKGPELALYSDDELKDYLEKKWLEAKGEKAPTLPGKVGGFIGGLAGSVAESVIGGLIGSVPGVALAFASQSGHDAFVNAGIKALSEGKSIDHALTIAKGMAPVGATIGAASAVSLPGKIPATKVQALKAGALPAGIISAGTILENIAQRELGLKTPWYENVPETAGTMFLIPSAQRVAGPYISKGLQAGLGVTERGLRVLRERVEPTQPRPSLQDIRSEIARLEVDPDVTRKEVVGFDPNTGKPTIQERIIDKSLKQRLDYLRSLAANLEQQITERPTDAVSIGEAKALLVGETPRDSGAMEQGVRERETPANVQAQQAKAGEQPAPTPREGALDIGQVASELEPSGIKVRPLSIMGQRRWVVDYPTPPTPEGTTIGTMHVPEGSSASTIKSEIAKRVPGFEATEATAPEVSSSTQDFLAKAKARLEQVSRSAVARLTPETVKAVQALPPVPEAHVRWWHGETPGETGGQTGMYHAEALPGDPLAGVRKALQYGRNLSYIDLPRELSDRYKAQHRKGESAILDSKLLSARKEVGTFEQPISAVIESSDLETPKAAEPTPVTELGRGTAEKGMKRLDELHQLQDYGQLTPEQTAELEVLESAARTKITEGPKPVTEPAKAEVAPPKLPETPEQAKTPPVQPPQPPGQAPPGTPPVPPPAPASPPPPPPPPPPRLSMFAPAIRRAHIWVKAMQGLFTARGNRAIMTQTFDGADSAARIAGQQARMGLEIGTTPIQQEAIYAVIESKGNKSKLDKFLEQSSKGGNRKAYDAVIYAQKNWDKLQDLARRTRERLDNEIHHEQLEGINVEYHQDYLPHVYDMDLWMGEGRPFVIAGGVGLRGAFKKGRIFDTIFDAIEAGYTPKSLNAAQLVEHRIRAGQQLINRKHWADGLRGEYDPTDNRPLVTNLERRSRGPGQPSYEVAPMGYVSKEILPGQRIAVHEAYSPLFNALTGTSFISGTVPGRLILQAAGGIKHGLLLFDTFHLSRIAQKEAALTGHVSFRQSKRPGQSLLEYADADLQRAVQENLIPQEFADWCKANRADANLLIREGGMNVGRIHEQLYTGFIRKIPGIGTFNKYTFEKVTRSALLQSGLIELERLRSTRPELTDRQRALQIGRDLNVYFGNLGRQGLFKSQSMLDLSHIIGLAPQWVESMARTEVRGGLQLAKGLTYDPIVHRNILVGTLGRGVGQGLLAYFIGTQLLNLATRRQFTWQNEEKEHKLDAWIPDITGKSPGFFLSPFSVVAELTHDFIRYSHTEKSKLHAAMRIARNKASPLWRAGRLIADGEQFDGTKIQDSWNRVKAAAVALVPSPIPLSPFIRGTDYPGQVQRQLTASMGVKTEPAPRAQQQISQMARDFVTAQGKKIPLPPPRTEEPGYANLRNALRRADKKDALKVLNEMLQSRTPATINKAMRDRIKHPFTGSTKMESQFKSTLNDRELELYQRAVDERREEYKQFQDLISEGI